MGSANRHIARRYQQWLGGEVWKDNSQRMTSCLTGSLCSVMVVLRLLDACYAALAEALEEKKTAFICKSRRVSRVHGGGARCLL
jgi:hypothetical protein